MNRTLTITLIALGVSILGAACSATGFSFRDLQKVDTPRGIQENTGLPAVLPLSKADMEKEKRDSYNAGLELGKNLSGDQSTT